MELFRIQQQKPVRGWQQQQQSCNYHRGYQYLDTLIPSLEEVQTALLSLSPVSAAPSLGGMHHCFYSLQSPWLQNQNVQSNRESLMDSVPTRTQ